MIVGYYEDGPNLVTMAMKPGTPLVGHHGRQSPEGCLEGGHLHGLTSTSLLLTPRFVSDEPVESMTVDDLSVRSAPGLWGKLVNDLAADCEFVEPLMENFGFGGPQQGEPDAFKPDTLLACCRIRSHHRNYAVEHAVSYGIRRAVAATEILVGVKGELSTENICIEAERFARCTGKSDIDLWRRHVQSIQIDQPRIFVLFLRTS